METTVESSDYMKVLWVWTSEVERVAAVVADTEIIFDRAVVVVDDWVVETNSIEPCVQTYYSYCNGVVKIERFDFYCSSILPIVVITLFLIVVVFSMVVVLAIIPNIIVSFLVIPVLIVARPLLLI